MLELGSFGEEMNLLVVQGADFGPVTATMTNPDTSPADLTGCVIRGQVRTIHGKHLLNLDVTISSPLTGVYELVIPAEKTVKLPAGFSVEDPDSNHTWDLEMVDSAGALVPLYYGKVSVRRKVTKL